MKDNIKPGDIRNLSFENALKKALNTPLPKKTKKLKPWLGLPLDLQWFSGLFGKKPL